MLVKSVMSTPVISIPPKYTVGQALEVMRSKRVKHLPVISKDSVLGLVSESDLLKVFPKKGLNNFEMNLLSRTPITQVMVPNPTVIHPDETLEKAALIMQSCSISSLPVVDSGNLVGMLAETDVINTFMNVMGIGQTGVRITLKYSRRIGFLAQIIKTFDDLGIIIDKFVAFQTEIVLKVKIGNQDMDLLRQHLTSLGYEVLHMAHDTSILSCELAEYQEELGS